MRDHAVVSPLFWSGHTGQQLRKDPDAQRLALYLMTCPNSNMIGLYYLPIPVICHELGMVEAQVRKALRRGYELQFCEYDEASEVVFVYEMSRFQTGKTLKAKDKRRFAVERLLLPFCKCRFYNDFLKKYGAPYKLTLEPLRSPFEGGNTERGQEQEQEQEQEQDILSIAQMPTQTKEQEDQIVRHELSFKQTPEGFDEFWSGHPNKTKRQRAVEAWKILNPDLAMRRRVMEGQRRWLASQQWKDGCVELAATWLNERLFDEHPEPAKVGEVTESREEIIKRTQETLEYNRRKFGRSS